MALSIAAAPAAGRPRRHKARRHAAATEETADASNGDARHRVMVLPFHGPRAVSARTAVRKALAAEATIALVALPRKSADEAAVIGQAVGHDLTALVRGRITRVGRNVLATLTVLGGSDGQPLPEEVTIQGETAAKLLARLRSDLWTELGPLIEKAAASPSPAPAPAAASPERGAAGTTAAAEPSGTETPEAAPPPENQDRVVAAGDTPRAATVQKEQESEDQAESQDAAAATVPGGCSALDLELAGGVFVRFFNYLYELRGALRADTQTRAPVGLAEGTFYPFALGSCGAAANVGLRLGYERMDPINSRLAERQLPTTASAYHAELVLRIALGALTLTPSAGYFERQYDIQGEVIPKVDYRLLGAGLDATLKLGPWVFELGAGGRLVLASGEIASADWFPGPTVFGLAGRARIGVALSDRFELLAGLNTEYYHFKFNIVPGGAYPNGVAGGAYDVYLQGLLALRIHL